MRKIAPVKKEVPPDVTAESLILAEAERYQRAAITWRGNAEGKHARVADCLKSAADRQRVADMLRDYVTQFNQMRDAQQECK